MDYEKLYKDALSRARAFELPEYKNIMVSVFPELKDSEDERIRKNLLELFHDTVSNDEIFSNYGLDKTEVLAWLEKQCEPQAKDFEAFIKKLSEQFPEVSFAKLSRIAVRVINYTLKD